VDVGLSSKLLAALRDDAMRVRLAALRRLPEDARLAQAGRALVLERLQSDSWPVVREAAALALIGVSASERVDSALADALADEAPMVRRRAAMALGRRGASAHAEAIARRFDDVDEPSSVRAAAALALGELCDDRRLDELTLAVRQLAAARPGPDRVVVGRAALQSLARLAPPDLDQRLAALALKPRSPWARDVARARRAVACRRAAPEPSRPGQRRRPASSKRPGVRR
jgi:HEAT repeat protein